MENRKHLFFSDREELSKKEDDIINALYKIQAEMQITRKNLDIVTDECLIDSYIYELTALNKRYQYFLRIAKRDGITAFKTEGL